jgi:putative endonuclease
MSESERVQVTWRNAPDRISVGRLGEDAAWRFLEPLGYTVLHRNWRSGRFELDLIVRDPKGILVFVEVKANRSMSHGNAAERVDRRKQMRLQRLAQSYVLSHDLQNLEMRFDVIGIEDGLAGPVITHHKNAFLPANSDYFGF